MPEPVSDTTLRDQIAEAMMVAQGAPSVGRRQRAIARILLPLLVERDRKVKEEAWDEGAVFAAPGRDFRYGNPYRIETKEEQK
jgi:hypothetical protein